MGYREVREEAGDMGANGAITCDVFELVAEVGGGELCYQYWSDLPPGTRVLVACFRKYRDMAGSDSVWSLYDDEEFLQPSFKGDFSGAKGRLGLREGDESA